MMKSVLLILALMPLFVSAAVAGPDCKKVNGSVVSCGISGAMMPMTSDVVTPVLRIPDPAPSPPVTKSLGMQSYRTQPYDLEFWRAHPDYLARVLDVREAK